MLSSHSRSYVLGEPFPDENGKKNKPEEPDTFLLQEDTLATMHGIEQLNRGD
jgi:hypothetical protein